MGWTAAGSAHHWDGDGRTLVPWREAINASSERLTAQRDAALAGLSCSSRRARGPSLANPPLLLAGPR